VRTLFPETDPGTLQNKAFIFDEQLSQVRIHAYLPRATEGSGQVLYFRANLGHSCSSQKSKSMAFELLDVRRQSAPASEIFRKIWWLTPSSVFSPIIARGGSDT